MRSARRILLGTVLAVCLPLACWVDVFGGLASAQLERGIRPPERPAPRAADARRVILVSIDGLAPYVMSQVQTPTLDRLMAEGVVARRAETIVPSNTMPTHTSMISGLRPEGHGVLWNRYEPWRRITTTTLFTLCRENGLRCGLFAGKRKFAHFAEHEPGVERWAHGENGAAVWAAARAYLSERDPHFTMIHIAEVDWSGHAHDWGSAEQKAAIREVDADLGRFLEWAEKTGSGRLAAIVTSDHGGHDGRHGTDDPRDVEIPWILWGEGIAPGVVDGVVSTVDTGPTVLRLLALPVPPGWTGRPRP